MLSDGLFYLAINALFMNSCKLKGQHVHWIASDFFKKFVFYKSTEQMTCLTHDVFTALQSNRLVLTSGNLFT